MVATVTTKSQDSKGIQPAMDVNPVNENREIDSTVLGYG